MATTQNRNFLAELLQTIGLAAQPLDRASMTQEAIQSEARKRAAAMALQPQLQQAGIPAPLSQPIQVPDIGMSQPRTPITAQRPQQRQPIQTPRTQGTRTTTMTEQAPRATLIGQEKQPQDQRSLMQHLGAFATSNLGRALIGGVLPLAVGLGSDKNLAGAAGFASGFARGDKERRDRLERQRELDIKEREKIAKPTWAQEQQNEAIKTGLARGIGYVSKGPFGELEPMPIKTYQDALTYLQFMKRDPKSFAKELKKYQGGEESTYAVGQILEVGNKKYEVTGFDKDGEPLVEEVR